MIHYHGTPITPRSALLELAGRHFCVSHPRPDYLRTCHEIGQSVLLDNGAFSAWRGVRSRNAREFYEWAEPWLDYPTTWVVVPDQVEGDEEANERLLAEWRARGLPKGAPVWHLHESLDRLRALCFEFERVCFGSSGAYRVVGSDAWHRRIAEAFDAIAEPSGRVPWVHMLRGMSMARFYPFGSVDSTDVARNHNRPQNTPRQLAERWDAMQGPARWLNPGVQMEVGL